VLNRNPAIVPELVDDIPQIAGSVIAWNGQPVNALTGFVNVNLRRARQYTANSDKNFGVHFVFSLTVKWRLAGSGYFV
jgi:hypothetical protein